MEGEGQSDEVGSVYHHYKTHKILFLASDICWRQYNFKRSQKYSFSDTRDRRQVCFLILTLSRGRFLSYRNQSIDLFCKW